MTKTCDLPILRGWIFRLPLSVKAGWTMLDLGVDEQLVVRDHELPLRIAESMTFAESATLMLVLADVAWGSTIGIEPDVVPD
jgi:hypothetical protein